MKVRIPFKRMQKSQFERLQIINNNFDYMFSTKNYFDSLTANYKSMLEHMMFLDGVKQFLKELENDNNGTADIIQEPEPER